MYGGRRMHTAFWQGNLQEKEIMWRGIEFKWILNMLEGMDWLCLAEERDNW
jgi:hypothetical protein